MVPALAALSARAARADEPSPLALDGPGAGWSFSPSAPQAAAWEALRAAFEF